MSGLYTELAKKRAEQSNGPRTKRSFLPYRKNPLFKKQKSQKKP
jgi:hypothetical protein